MLHEQGSTTGKCVICSNKRRLGSVRIEHRRSGPVEERKIEVFTQNSVCDPCADYSLRQMRRIFRIRKQAVMSFPYYHRSFDIRPNFDAGGSLILNWEEPLEKMDGDIVNITAKVDVPGIVSRLMRERSATLAKLRAWEAAKDKRQRERRKAGLIKRFRLWLDEFAKSPPWN